MMDKTIGILIYTKIIKDNDLYIRILSQNDEIISGIVYGGNSSKKKNIYQNGYYLKFSYSKRNENRPNTIIAEIHNPFMGSIIDDKYKLSCLLSIMSIINIVIVEGQKVKDIYKLIDKFLNKLISEKTWIRLYCKWIFDLLKIIGYEIDYKSNLNKKFFNISTQMFTEKNNDNVVVFPHQYLISEKKIDINSLNIIFLIFEYILKNNHLMNNNYSLPIPYMRFRKIILDFFKI